MYMNIFKQLNGESTRKEIQVNGRVLPSKLTCERNKKSVEKNSWYSSLPKRAISVTASRLTVSCFQQCVFLCFFFSFIFLRFTLSKRIIRLRDEAYRLFYLIWLPVRVTSAYTNTVKRQTQKKKNCLHDKKFRSSLFLFDKNEWLYLYLVEKQVRFLTIEWKTVGICSQRQHRPRWA